MVLPPAGVEQRDRRLVGVDDARAEHERPVGLVQRHQLRPRLTAPGGQCRARRVNTEAGVDLLLPVVGDVIDKAADAGVGLQARRWQRVVEDLGRGRLLHEQLAAPAGPLAANLPLHEELRRNDVQAFADVFAHAHHRLATLWRRAIRVFGLDALVHARQVRRKCFALGLAAGLLVGCTGAWGGVWGGALQGRELGLQAGLVGGERLLEDVALLGVHGLGLGAELPGPQPRELEGDALDLRVAPLDGLRLGVDPPVLLANVFALFANVFALLANVGQHLRCHYRQFASAERLDILGCDHMHIEHAAIVQSL